MTEESKNHPSAKDDIDALYAAIEAKTPELEATHKRLDEQIYGLVNVLTMTRTSESMFVQLCISMQQSLNLLLKQARASRSAEGESYAMSVEYTLNIVKEKARRNALVCETLRQRLATGEMPDPADVEKSIQAKLDAVEAQLKGNLDVADKIIEAVEKSEIPADPDQN